MGLSLELDDVALEPLVPEAIIEESDLESLYHGLAGYAPEMRANNPATHLRHAQPFVAFYTLRYWDFR